MTETRVVELGGRRIEVSRPDKVLFPDAGVTKLDLAEYYASVAETMLPHLQDRPLAFKRYPDGIDREGFFQKDVPDHYPDWIERVDIPKEGGSITQVVLRDELAALVYLADQAAITPHAWLATTDALDRPDRLVIDLDPSNGDLQLVRAAARDVRTLFEDLGLAPFIMTTGSRGFHVVSPIEPDASFDETRALAHDIAELLCRRHPERYTIASRKEDRGERIYLDYLRNAYAQTSVAPYAVRARPGAPVATPIDWSELAGLAPDRWTLRSIPRRLGQKEDPWQDIDRHPRSTGPVREALDALLADASRGD